MKSTTSKMRLVCAFSMRAMFALLTAIFVLGIGAQAATVTNEQDSGAGSLRQAITDAATGETIIFSYGKAMVISLTSPITIDKDIVIDGSGNYDVTISGGQATSIFKIASGNVEISSLTLRDGLAQGGNGENNGRWTRHASGGGGAGMGGAIAVAGGTVLINGVEFIDNKAKGGNGGNSTAPLQGAFAEYAGAGGGSIFGSGGSRVNWGNNYHGTAGGFGGGGSGGLCYPGDSSSGSGGSGGFGGGGGGGATGVHYTGVYPYTIKSPGSLGQAGLFGGAGSAGQSMSHGQGYGTGGGGGGGAGLGGALFIKSGDVTLSNSTFTGSVAEGGSGGAGSAGGADGQGVGGAIFVYQTGNLVLIGSTFAQSQSSVSGINNNDIYVINFVNFQEMA